MRGARSPLWWGALAVALSAGCEERRVINRRVALRGIPGAVGGEDVDAPLAGGSSDRPAFDAINNPANYATPRDLDATLRVKGPDNKPRLVSRNPREMLLHLRTTLANEEYDLLLGQIVAEQTKSEYRKRGKDPAEAVEFFRRHRDDILRLVQEFPLGELTPDRMAQPIGPSTFRLEVPELLAGGSTRGGGLLFRRIDYIFEPDACRLLLID